MRRPSAVFRHSTDVIALSLSSQMRFPFRYSRNALGRSHGHCRPTIVSSHRRMHSQYSRSASMRTRLHSCMCVFWALNQMNNTSWRTFSILISRLIFIIYLAFTHSKYLSKQNVRFSYTLLPIFIYHFHFYAATFISCHSVAFSFLIPSAEFFFPFIFVSFWFSFLFLKCEEKKKVISSVAE